MKSFLFIAAGFVAGWVLEQTGVDFQSRELTSLPGVRELRYVGWYLMTDHTAMGFYPYADLDPSSILDLRSLTGGSRA